MFFYFELIFELLQAEHNNVIVMAVYVSLHAACLVLRMLAFLIYRSQNILLDSAKPLKAISETANIRSGVLRRISADYIAAAKKNAPRVPLAAIVEKQVLGLSLLGWRCAGIGLWTEKMESGLIFLGLVLALIFPEYGVVYGLLAVAGFILMKLGAGLFDFNTARLVLVADLILYVERELGQFFAGHTAGAILQLKENMAEAVEQQSEVLKEAVEKLGDGLYPALVKLECLDTLPRALEKMQQSNDRYALHHESFVAQSQIIKDAQLALETSLTSYESTLQNLVQTMGNGLGTFVELYGQNASNAMTDAMQNHIKTINESNRETIEAITSLLDQLTTQSRDVSNHLRALHERIEETH